MATLNPGIILQGATPNIMASFDQGQQAGARQNAIGQQNALASLYQSQGAGIAAGDQNALNALAAIDPMASLGVQGQRQGMAATQQRMDMLSREEERQIQAQAASLSAAERAAEAQRIEQGVAMGLGAQTPEQWDAIMQQQAPDLVGQFDNREMLANRFMSIADVLKRQDGPAVPPAVQTLQWRAQQAGLQPGTPAYEEFMVKGSAPSTNVTVNTGEGDKFYETLDKSQATMFQGLIDDGIKAGRSIQTLDQMAELLESAPTGFGAAVQTRLGEFGIPSEGLSELQALQALINQIVPEQRQPGSGPMSDADLALFKQSVPRIINQPGGNRIILERMRGIAQYQAQQAQIANAVTNREMTPAQGRAALADLANPLEGFGATLKDLPPAPQEGGSAQPTRLRYNPATGEFE